MTDTAPQTQLGISIVRTGETIHGVDQADGTSVDTVATEDLVVLQIIPPGATHKPGAFMTPQQAYETATALAQAAAKLLNARIDDDGNKLGLLATLRDLGRQA